MLLKRDVVAVAVQPQPDHQEAMARLRAAIEQALVEVRNQVGYPVTLATVSHDVAVASTVAQGPRWYASALVTFEYMDTSS